VLEQMRHLPTKVGELTELARNQAVDLILLQETKLGCGDLTPRFPVYECLRLDQPGSELTLRRGGGLAVYIRENIPYNLMGTTTLGPLELQALRIPVSARLNLCLANAYLPPSHQRTPHQPPHQTPGSNNLKQYQQTSSVGI